MPGLLPTFQNSLRVSSQAEPKPVSLSLLSLDGRGWLPHAHTGSQLGDQCVTEGRAKGGRWPGISSQVFVPMLGLTHGYRHAVAMWSLLLVVLT